MDDTLIAGNEKIKNKKIRKQEKKKVTNTKNLCQIKFSKLNSKDSKFIQYHQLQKNADLS